MAHIKFGQFQIPFQLQCASFLPFLSHHEPPFGGERQRATVCPRKSHCLSQANVRLKPISQSHRSGWRITHQRRKRKYPSEEKNPAEEALNLRNSERVEDHFLSNGVDESLVAEWMNVDTAELEIAKKSSYAASEFVESLSNGPAFEVLPFGDGVWKVKLMIDTKQSETFSEQGNTEALIAKMRMVTSSASLTPRHAKCSRDGVGGLAYSTCFEVPN